MKNIVISWSSGKDSTLTLLRLLEDPCFNVVALLTTYVKDSVPFQETPIDVVRLQAQKVDLPLILVELPKVFPENSVYQSLVVDGINKSGLSVVAVAFGDMFRNGITDYRKSYIEPAGWECVFPLLEEEPSELAEEIVNRGIKTFVTCVDTSQCSREVLGKEYTKNFLDELPDNIDPCGENGEFHTFVYNASCFSSPISIEKLAQVINQRFHIQKYSAG